MRNRPFSASKLFCCHCNTQLSMFLFFFFKFIMTAVDAVGADFKIPCGVLWILLFSFHNVSARPHSSQTVQVNQIFLFGVCNFSKFTRKSWSCTYSCKLCFIRKFSCFFFFFSIWFLFRQQENRKQKQHHWRSFYLVAFNSLLLSIDFFLSNFWLTFFTRLRNVKPNKR